MEDRVREILSWYRSQNPGVRAGGGTPGLVPWQVFWYFGAPAAYWGGSRRPGHHDAPPQESLVLRAGVPAQGLEDWA